MECTPLYWHAKECGDWIAFIIAVASSCLKGCFRLQLDDLVVKAEWCRRYAQINAVGLRKILKKHDKLCRNKLGNTYMQVCACCHASGCPQTH